MLFKIIPLSDICVETAFTTTSTEIGIEMCKQKCLHKKSYHALVELNPDGKNFDLVTIVKGDKEIPVIHKLVSGDRVLVLGNNLSFDDGTEFKPNQEAQEFINFLTPTKEGNLIVNSYLVLKKLNDLGLKVIVPNIIRLIMDKYDHLSAFSSIVSIEVLSSSERQHVLTARV